MAAIGRNRIAGGLSVGFALSLATVPAGAAANPVAGDIDIGDPPQVLLFLSLNFITNLFIVSALLLAFGYMWRKNIGRPDPDRNQFVLKVLAGAFAITLMGSGIDLGLLYERSFDSWYTLRFNGTRWGLALLLVFLSVYPVARGLLRLRRRVAVLLGAGMAVANIFFWFTQLDFQKGAEDLPLYLLFVVPFLLFAVRRWHQRTFAGNPVASAGHTQEPPEAAPEGPAPTPSGAAAQGPPVERMDDIEKAIDTLES